MNFKARLGEIRAPTLVISGENDVFYAKEDVQDTAAGIPNATLKMYPGYMIGYALFAVFLTIPLIALANDLQYDLLLEGWVFSRGQCPLPSGFPILSKTQTRGIFPRKTLNPILSLTIRPKKIRNK